jgi:hypothetical protein
MKRVELEREPGSSRLFKWSGMNQALEEKSRHPSASFD